LTRLVEQHLEHFDRRAVENLFTGRRGGGR
jgi:hypothetical protein